MAVARHGLMPNQNDIDLHQCFDAIFILVGLGPRRANQMTIRQLMVSASAFFLLTLPCEAGPCSQDISRMRTAIDAKLNALASTGPSETQGIGAQLHRQP